jgi:hypothetical protein
MTAADILNRIKAATGPDRELDARIACYFKGVEFVKERKDGWFTYYDGENAYSLWPHPKHYTSSIDAILALVEKEFEAPIAIIDSRGHCRLRVSLDREASSYGVTVSLAILAALFTAIVERERDDTANV